MARFGGSEEILFKAMEKAEITNDYYNQCWAALLLGRLCRNRGEFSQAIRLHEQILVVAERNGYQHSVNVIYNELGENYRMPGSYP